MEKPWTERIEPLEYVKQETSKMDHITPVIHVLDLSIENSIIANQPVQLCS